MAQTTVERTPSGKWRVSREFDSQSAATAAVMRLAEVNEAAYVPHKPIIASVPRVDHSVAQAAIRDGVQHQAVEAPMPPFATLDPDGDE